jgi:hypothetical protein
MSREFYPHKTHFFSLFVKTLSCHKKCIRDRLLNTNETLIKFSLRLALCPLWQGSWRLRLLLQTTIVTLFGTVAKSYFDSGGQKYELRGCLDVKKIGILLL